MKEMTSQLEEAHNIEVQQLKQQYEGKCHRDAIVALP